MRVDTYSQKRLFAAILNQGFLDLRSTKTKLRSDALQFLSSRYAYRYAEILGIDGEVLQRGVQKHLKKSKHLGKEPQLLLNFEVLK